MMTNGEMLDALDAAGFPLKTIENNHRTLDGITVTFGVRGSKGKTKVFSDWNWVSCFSQAYRQLVSDAPEPAPEIWVNGTCYRRVQ
jgi:hypothetical protein